ncbi:MAG: OmpA family protein [Myxococcota bacterium]
MLLALAALAHATHVHTFDVDPNYTKSPFSGLESLTVDPAVALGQLQPVSPPFAPELEILPARSREKALVFTNPTSTWAEIAVNGLAVGTIGPYATARFEGVRPGAYVVKIKLPTGLERTFVAYAGPTPRDARPISVLVGEKKLDLSDKIYFELDSAVIDPASYPLLDEVAKALAAAADVLVVRVEGHTDSRGAALYNQKLSEDRAAAVRDYLLGKGVAQERLVAAGFGESQPIDAAENEDAWEKNRRVEFVIEKRAEPAPIEQELLPPGPPPKKKKK